ncbi:MAG TPA: glycosyltransferase, partial [Gemmatimonadales bacterium]|nr:glycosyltransferase [Gemmatimonadales bacterium]
MRLLVLTEYFPNPFKPYFDEQTTLLAEAGADVRITAIGKWADRASTDGPVDLVARTTYAPREAASWRGLLASVRRAAHRPAHAAGLLHREMRLERRPRALAAVLTRALHLPADRPDCVLVHDLTTLYTFRGLRSAHPGVPIVLWYHGGEVPGSAVLPEPTVREVLRSVTLGIGNTEYAATALAARGVPRERIRVMPIG